ncbi:MAG: hypothetical protein AAB919_00745 [Patescibacteria group bacterium]
MKKFLTALTLSILFLFPIAALADNSADCVARGGKWTSGWFTSGGCSVPVGANANTPSNTNTLANGGRLTYIPLEPLPGGNPASYGSLSAYLNLVFKILISIGAMVAIITLVLAGITYMVSEIADKMSEAKRRIRAALLGLLLLLTCWLILYEINPSLLKFCIFGIDTTCSSAGTPPAAQPANQYAGGNAVQLDTKTIEQLQKTTDAGSLKVNLDDMNAANTQEAQFRRECESKGGQSKPTASDGQNSSTYTCFVPLYQP